TIGSDQIRQSGIRQISAAGLQHEADHIRRARRRPGIRADASEVAEFGRFINDEDTEKERRVIFLGSEVPRKLFGNAPAVGETIRVNGLTFEVIGVLTQKVSFSNYYSPDKYSVFIPHTTTKQLWNSDYLDNMVFQTLSVAQHNQAVKQVREVL